MLISELPEPIRKLAEKRKAESENSFDITTVEGAFGWIGTIEGGAFWGEISKGNFAPFYEKYPEHKPTTSEQPIKYTVEYCRANKVAIHCETRHKLDEVIKVGKLIFYTKSIWDIYREYSCITLCYLPTGLYSPIMFYQEQQYTIIPAAQFIADNTEQAQHDLPKQKAIDNSEMLTWLKQYVKENPEQAKKEWDEICKEVERKPILTTEDGVRVFEGDEPYVINKEFKIFGPYNPSNYRVFFNAVMESGCKYFSTRAAAEDYVLKNKECFSVADLMKFGIPIYESALINLAKNKLGING